ncbi:O-antigen ligase family protein [Aerococcus urinaeequi]|uniref:O-antigen ligase family protein n=1 Tax=Aerococcus urinaeequi TaxID=51665 RepID=UPI003B3B4FAC
MINSQKIENLRLDSKKKNKNISISLYLLLLSIGAYFFLTMFWSELYVIWTFLLIFADITYLFFKKDVFFPINLNMMIWGTFIVICILGLVNPNTTNLASGAMFHVLTLLLLYFNFLLLMGEAHWEETLLKFLLQSSWIFIIGAVIQLISPTFLQSLNQIQLDSEQYISFNNFMRWGYIVGFSSNPGITAFAITPVLFNSFINIFKKRDLRNQIGNFLIFIFVFILLIMTGKRGMTLFVLIIVAYLAFSLTKNKYYAILPMVFFGIFLIYLILNTGAGQDLIIRTITQDDLTTGRAPIYNIMWNKFLENPIGGIGTYSINNLIATKNGHNIYLQMLSENGIITFSLVIFILLYNLLKTHFLFYKAKTDNSRTILGFSVSQQIVFILWGITGNTLYDRYSLAIYFIAVAMMWVSLKDADNFERINNVKFKKQIKKNYS